MKDPKIETKVVHSQTKSAWNVVGVTFGKKFKIARFPYLSTDNKTLTDIHRIEAFEHAEFTSYCFNNSNLILTNINIKRTK